MGEVYAEGRALVEGALDRDVPLVLADDAVDCGQPQAGTLPGFLGGEEGIEDLLDDLRGHALAGVGDRDDGVAHRWARVRWRPVGGGDADSAVVANGVAAVDDQIENNLLELSAVYVDRSRRGVQVQVKFDIFADEALEQLAALADDGVDVGWRRPQGSLSPVGRVP